MKKKNRILNFKDIIDNHLLEINITKTIASSIHTSGNIRSSGNQVEDLIREKIRLFLPDRYMVKQGYIINKDGLVSNQFDILIFDRLSTPRFFETSDKSVYYPIESVIAVGEIKKTLTKNHLIEFMEKIKYLKVDMKRPLIENSVYDGIITDKTTLSDIANMKTGRKYKNSLFSFMFAVDCNNVGNILFSKECQYMPNDIYILNYGYYLNGRLQSDDTFVCELEDESQKMDYWAKIKKPGSSCFANLLNHLINHLNESRVEPISIAGYIENEDSFKIKGTEVGLLDFKLLK